MDTRKRTALLTAALTRPRLMSHKKKPMYLYIQVRGCGHYRGVQVE